MTFNVFYLYYKFKKEINMFEHTLKRTINPFRKCTTDIYQYNKFGNGQYTK